MSSTGLGPLGPTSSHRASLMDILASTPDFVSGHAPDGRLVFMNPTAREWLGLAPAPDKLGIDVSDIPHEFHDLQSALDHLYPPLAREILRAEGLPCAEASGVWRGETVVWGRDGQEIPVSQALIAHRDDSGDLYQLSIIMRDISHTKELEARISAEHDFRERLLAGLPNLFVLIDAQARIARWNREFERVFAGGRALAGMDCPSLVAPSNPSAIADWIDRVRAEGSGATEIEVVDRAGGHRWLALNAVRVEAEPRSDVSLIATDVTARREAEAREQRRNHILTALARDEPLEHILSLITQSIEGEAPDTICSVLLLDQAKGRLYHGATPRLPEFYSKAIDGVQVGEGMGSCGTAAWRGERVVVDDIRTDPLWAGYREVSLKAGLLACWSHPIRSAAGEILGTFAIYHSQPRTPGAGDIERIERAADLASLAIERKQLSDVLTYHASHDALTGLNNRRRIEERLHDEIQRTERYAHPLSLILIDVDRFKTVNDRHGHAIGDRVLRELVQALSAHLRETDACGRWGGEEFLLLLQETPIDGAIRLAEDLRQCMGETACAISYDVTVSLGVCQYQPGEGRDSVLYRVDAALYRAKSQGRNRSERG